VAAEGLAQRLTLCASFVVEVPLRLAVVEPEAGRVSTETGGALPWRISATWPPLTRASQASSAGKAGVITSEMVSAASENQTSLPWLGAAARRAVEDAQRAGSTKSWERTSHQPMAET